jgi:hypothetical protein
MTAPPRLFKYLRSEYAAAVLQRGALLFHNLTYFRKIEDRGRADLLESLHMDFPDNPVTLEGVNRPFKWVGRAAFLNSVNANRVFVFCLSELLEDALYAEFQADACIEIRSPIAFLSRLEAAISRHRRFAEAGLIHRPVEYYRPNAAVRGDVKNPREIPFFKHADYAHQREYRIATALARGFTLTEQIVLPEHNLEADVANGLEAERLIRIGSISDIAVLHRR